MKVFQKFLVFFYNVSSKQEYSIPNVDEQATYTDLAGYLWIYITIVLFSTPNILLALEYA